ncbi:MAG TPA: type II toxin-antitoxin system VapB family antitoxin [Bryobacteraceae bacterium]|nr:type II toxin-antitoxin system VapB family antitoxin [Bryobacteraceae bacterium]
MKKTLNIDEDLLKDAKEACGAKTDTEAVRMGLQALLRHAAYQRLREFAGSEPDAEDVPRRREPPAIGDEDENRVA